MVEKQSLEYMLKVKMASDVGSELLRGTPGFSGADLRNLIKAPLFCCTFQQEGSHSGGIEWARDKVMMGPERKSMVMSEDERKTTAYAEAGHAWYPPSCRTRTRSIR